MPKNHNYAVIVAGGVGARLWPLSRQNAPKQFQPILSETSLFKGTYSLLAKCLPKSHIFVQINRQQLPNLKRELPNFPDTNVIIEPIGRDTGPAYLFAAATLALRDPLANVAIFWSDHVINNHINFKQALATVFTTLTDFPDRIVSLGVTPTFAHTGLGYIKFSEKVRSYGTGSVYAVDQFVEKPDAKHAQEYLSSGKYLWNTGYSSFSVAGFESVLAAADSKLVTIFRQMKQNLANGKKGLLLQQFKDLPRISIDYWLMEKLKTMLVVPAELDWSDVSDWKTVHDLLSVSHGTDVVSKGHHVSVNCRNCLVIGGKRVIATVGLEDIVLIDTGDAILAIHKNNAQEMKQLIALLKDSKHKHVL